MALEQLTQLLYCSVPTEKFNISDIDDILTKCSRNNTRLKVTGVLVFDGKTFLQLLEGPPESIKEVYVSVVRVFGTSG